jgi:hypothetical protein
MSILNNMVKFFVGEQDGSPGSVFSKDEDVKNEKNTRSVKNYGDDLDLNVAIDSHLNWKNRLESLINENSKEKLNPDVICLDNKCELGRWLYGIGGKKLSKHPEFTLLIEQHKKFHYHAGEIVKAILDNNHKFAKNILETKYAQATSQIILILKRLKKIQEK